MPTNSNNDSLIILCVFFIHTYTTIKRIRIPYQYHAVARKKNFPSIKYYILLVDCFWLLLDGWIDWRVHSVSYILNFAITKITDSNTTQSVEAHELKCYCSCLCQFIFIQFSFVATETYTCVCERASARAVSTLHDDDDYWMVSQRIQLGKQKSQLKSNRTSKQTEKEK